MTFETTLPTLKIVREALGLSQVGLDALAGLPRGTVCAIETRKMDNPTLAVCMAIRDALRAKGARGTDLDSLFGTPKDDPPSSQGFVTVAACLLLTLGSLLSLWTRDFQDRVVSGLHFDRQVVIWRNGPVIEATGISRPVTFSEAVSVIDEPKNPKRSLASKNLLHLVCGECSDSQGRRSFESRVRTLSSRFSGLSGFPSLPTNNKHRRNTDDDQQLFSSHRKTVPASRATAGLACLVSGFFLLGWATRRRGDRFASGWFGALALYLCGGFLLFG